MHRTVVLALAVICTCPGLMAPPASASAAATRGSSPAAVAAPAVQMTQREFRKIKGGMTLGQVRQIVGATGTQRGTTSTCYTRSYTTVLSAGSSNRAWVGWEKKNGVFRVYGKTYDSSSFFCAAGPS